MNFSDYFEYLHTPETWSSLEEFGSWYLANKMPMRIPFDSHVFTTENVTSFIAFRQGVYQAELYVVRPNIKTSEHYHPDLEVIICQIGTMNDWGTWGKLNPVLEIGSSHGAEFPSEKGAVFISFEKWKQGAKMTSATANWKGFTDGPLHDALIKQHYPNAYIKDGYADVSRNMI